MNLTNFSSFCLLPGGLFKVSWGLTACTPGSTLVPTSMGKLYVYLYSSFCGLIFWTFLMYRQTVYVEMVVQGDVATSDLIAPPKPDGSAQLRAVDLAIIDHDVQALVVHLEILIGLVKVNCVVAVAFM